MSRSNNKVLGVVGEQRQLTSDLTEKLAWPEMTRARLATCALRGERQTAKARPCQGEEAALELQLACARRRGSQGELVVQRNWHGVKWCRLATMRAVTGLNGTVTGKAPKLELGLAAIKAGWGRLERGCEGGDASTRN